MTTDKPQSTTLTYMIFETQDKTTFIDGEAMADHLVNSGIVQNRPTAECLLQMTRETQVFLIHRNAWEIWTRVR